MKRTLLDWLICPVDDAGLALSVDASDGDEILAGELRCGEGHRFPVTGGVPRLLPPDQRADAFEQTKDSFSAKWARIRDFGHEPDSHAVYVGWYLERYGFDGLSGFGRFLADKRRILDAGTGLGRDARLYAENSRADVVALDVSSSIDDAYRHVGRLPNVHLLQADLSRMPFRSGAFDFVVSDQVIHHTENTRAAFESLVRVTAPGGDVAFYVYRKKGPVREFCDDYLREHFVSAPEDETYEFSRAMTLLGKALSELNVEVDVPMDIPALGIKAGLQDVQRFIYWNVFKCYWNDRLDFETNVMTNFDWYRPRYAHRHTPDEVQGWCRDAGLEIQRFHVIESGISVLAHRPGDRDE